MLLLSFPILDAEAFEFGAKLIGDGVFLGELGFELGDCIRLARDLAALAGDRGLELLDGHLQPAGRHGELGAQLVAVCLNLGQRYRD